MGREVKNVHIDGMEKEQKKNCLLYWMAKINCEKM
jgi:hypothetical protein